MMGNEMTPQGAAEITQALAILRKYAPEMYEAWQQLQDLKQGRGQGGNGKGGFWTWKELLETPLSAPVQIIPDILPVGLVLLSGRPKTGKSWLAMQAVVAVASGGYFLGRRVEQAPVLYIDLENGAWELQERLRKMGAPPTPHSYCTTEWPKLNDGGLDRLALFVRQRQPRLVVIDTLTRAFSGRIDWNDVGAATDALSELQHLALEYEISVLCVDHHRKNKGMLADVVDDILGSTGKSAVPDAIWGLYRKRGERRGELHITGRQVHDAELVVEWDTDTCCWQLVGDARETALTETQNEILEILQEFGEAGADADDVGKEAGVSRPAARKVLEKLVAMGKVTRRIERGKGGALRVVYAVKPAGGTEEV